MRLTYDPAKDAHNVSTRGISFAAAADFEWSGALIVEDRRRDYGERRMRAMGYLDGRLHVVVFTDRADATHVISLRRANQRERTTYERLSQS